MDRQQDRLIPKKKKQTTTTTTKLVFRVGDLKKCHNQSIDLRPLNKLSEIKKYPNL